MHFVVNKLIIILLKDHGGLFLKSLNPIIYLSIGLISCLETLCGSIQELCTGSKLMYVFAFIVVFDGI